MFLWGLGWPAGKIVSAYGSAESIALLRYIIIFLSMLIIVLLFKIDLRINLKGLWLLVVSGIFLALYTILFLTGLQQGFAGSGGVLVTSTNPIFAYLIGLIISKQIPVKREIIGLFIGVIAGIFLLNLWSSFDEIFKFGNMYFLTGAFIWAVTSKFTSRAGYYGTSLAFSFWMFLITLLCFIIVGDLTEVKNIIVNGDAFFWSVMIYFGTGAAALATSFYFFATTRIGAEKASSFIFLVPFSAALSSFIFLGEIIYIHTIIGGILAMIAVFIINKRKSKKIE